MAVTIKSEREIALMRESCKRLADVFYNMEKAVEPVCLPQILMRLEKS